jgi:hypothetical protein
VHSQEGIPQDVRRCSGCICCCTSLQKLLLLLCQLVVLEAMQLCCYGLVALGHALRHVMDCVTHLSNLNAGLVKAAGQLSCRQLRAAQHSAAQLFGLLDQG